jgi:hypothetical protein
MVRSFWHGGVAVTSFALAIALSFPASAKSKMTYEQAFTKCKGEIAANVPMTDSNTSAARHSAGAACMKKYGYRLKKGAM